ncbi:TIGR00266 family protein [Rubripirellula amarantea]|nr:TIGR00266 family protein [Rubripirellula amarantea]
MEFRVCHAPAFSTLEFSLSAGDFVVAQPNSMLSMTAKVGISAHAGRQDSANQTANGQRKNRHSILGGFKSWLGGESFFTAEFSAKADMQSLVLAPESYGDIVALDVSASSGYYLTHGSYLANIGPTDVHVKYGGVKGLMSRKGLFLMHATGRGESGDGFVFCQTFGAIEHRRLEADEVLFVDNRFVVAFADTVTYQLVKATDSIKDSLLSGEGLINRYTGPGDVYYQTRGKPSGGFLSTVLQAAF